MSDSRLLEKYIGRVGEEGPRRSPLDLPVNDADTDDLGCFGWLRGVKERAVMLELRKKDGGITAISYSWLERVSFDPSEGITLYVGSMKVRIKGRNLNAEIRSHVRLFEGITRFRVPWIAEADRAADIGASTSAVIVESIEW